MKVQDNGIIRLSGNPEDALERMVVWKRSSAVFWIRAEYDVSEVSFKIGNAAATAYSATLAGVFSPDRGLWRVYAPASCFPEAASTYYKVVTKDAFGSRNVAGEGELKVVAGKIDDPEDEPQSGE